MGMKHDRVAGSLVTSDATPSQVSGAAITLGDGNEGVCLCWLSAKSGANTKGFLLWASVERAAGGAAAIIGSPLSVVVAQGDAGLVLAVATLVAAGNTIVPQVTGIALTSITWTVLMELVATY